MLNSKSPLHLLSKVWAIGVLLLFSCQSFADTTSGGATPPPPPPPPSVTVTTGDPGDPNPVETDSCLVSAGVKNAPLSQDESATIQHWSWSVGTVTVTPYDGSADITADASDFSISLNPIVDPGKPDDGKIDDSNPAAMFTGTFRLTGYYAIPVTATVHFVDSVTGADDGTASNTDYVGDPQDNPAYDPTVDYADPSTSGAATAPNAMGEHPNAPLSSAPAPPTKPALPPRRLVSGIFAKLPNPIKLGLFSKNHSKESFTLTVLPRAKVGDVSFTVANGVASTDPQPETMMNAKGQLVQTGKLVLTLTAVKRSGSLSGDAMTATQTSTNKAIGGATVLVLEPLSLDKTPAFNGSIVGEKFLENNKSSPADLDIQFPEVGLFVLYGTRLKMQVRDQFTQPLDAIFAGTDVEESLDAIDNGGRAVPTTSINTLIGADGSYLDPVDFSQQNTVDPTEPSSTSGFAATWSGPASSQPRPIPQPYTQRIHVYIGGDELHPSPAVHRTLSIKVVDHQDGTTTLLFTVQPL